MVLSQEIVTRLHNRTKDFLREKQNNILKSKEKKTSFIRCFKIIVTSYKAGEQKKNLQTFNLKTRRHEKKNMTRKLHFLSAVKLFDCLILKHQLDKTSAKQKKLKFVVILFTNKILGNGWFCSGIWRVL